MGKVIKMSIILMEYAMELYDELCKKKEEC